MAIRLSEDNHSKLPMHILHSVAAKSYHHMCICVYVCMCMSVSVCVYLCV